MKTLATSLFLVVVLSATASAQQRGSLTLGWDDCRTTGGVNCRAFACDTNSNAASAVHNLVGGYVAGQNVTELVSWVGSIDIYVEALTLPPWWQHGAPPACRGTNDLVLSFVNAPGVSCYDHQSQIPGGALGGGSYDYPAAGVANHARIRYVAAIDPAAALPSIPQGTETYLLDVTIRNGNTVAPSACGGCLINADLTHSRVDLEQRNGDNFSVVYRSPYDPGAPSLPPDEAVVGWQGGTDYHRCQLPASSINRTWGSIKSIYR